MKDKFLKWYKDSGEVLLIILILLGGIASLVRGCAYLVVKGDEAITKSENAVKAYNSSLWNNGYHSYDHGKWVFKQSVSKGGDFFCSGDLYTVYVCNKCGRVLTKNNSSGDYKKDKE